MADPFIYNFETELPTADFQQGWERYQGQPLLDEIAGQAMEAISALEVFTSLPARNQKLVLDMAAFALESANSIADKWRENFWGLYVVGSRARGEAGADSDLDLLSAGTFYRSQGFSTWFGKGVFEGFDLENPAELPSEYNTGAVDRKYLVRATPLAEGVLPVDLNVVDLTFWRATLDSFKETMDVSEDGSQLPRVPVFELTVPQERRR